MPEIANLIESALVNPSIRSTVLLLLNHASEVKHEDTISSLISAHLREQGETSRRNVTKSRMAGSERTRRVDIVIRGQEIEAKYHYEGDIVLIDEKLKVGSRFTFDPTKKRGRKEAEEVCAEILRPPPAYFLWMVCVRSLDELDKGGGRPYGCGDLIAPFYERCNKRGVGSRSHVDARLVAEAEIDGPIWGHFTRFAKTWDREIHLVRAMPTIVGDHSSLITRLYRISSTG